jgi:hypothetical protein
MGLPAGILIGSQHRSWRDRPRGSSGHGHCFIGWDPACRKDAVRIARGYLDPSSAAAWGHLPAGAKQRLLSGNKGKR